jgi:hypothetical protein
MKEKHHWPTTSIRVNPEALHQARIAAVTRKKMLGQWLEEAILEKIEREGKLGKEGKNEENHGRTTSRTCKKGVLASSSEFRI